MKSRDVFFGTIKKCEDLYNYKKYGDEHYTAELIIGKTEIGTTHKYADVIDEEAVLVKIDDENYMWIDMIDNKLDEFLLNLGISYKTISTTPTKENRLFVDEDTIEPYFKNQNKNISVKKFKSIVSLFKE